MRRDRAWAQASRAGSIRSHHSPVLWCREAHLADLPRPLVSPSEERAVLQAQAIPTIDQVGPRGLLQFGSLTPNALVGFLFWRKWIFDIDNRAAQGTGYLFEPIISFAIGGVPYSWKKSPIRGADDDRGRQVDCLLIDTKEAYEIKLRVTIAASGQGRWGKELQFPVDCKASGYKPRLLVLDPTPNEKLTALVAAFKAVEGKRTSGQMHGHI